MLLRFHTQHFSFTVSQTHQCHNNNFESDLCPSMQDVILFVHKFRWFVCTMYCMFILMFSSVLCLDIQSYNSFHSIINRCLAFEICVSLDAQRLSRLKASIFRQMKGWGWSQWTEWDGCFFTSDPTLFVDFYRSTFLHSFRCGSCPRPACPSSCRMRCR